MKTRLSILGSTGSIGTQALDVVRKLDLKVEALTANSNVKLIEQQIREFKPKFVAIMDSVAAKDLRTRVADMDVEITEGIDGLCEAASYKDSEIVLNSVVGMVGLKPTLAAIKSKKTIALANKETLVAGGHIVTRAAKENNVSILPVDSEHSAIFQSLQGFRAEDVKRIILTASGGPFFGKTKEELEKVQSVEMIVSGLVNCGWGYDEIKGFITNQSRKLIAV